MRIIAGPCQHETLEQSLRIAVECSRDCRKYDIEYVGPSNEHMVRFKWYVLNIDKKKTIKDIRSVIKAGQIA